MKEKRMLLVNGEYVWYGFVGEDNGTLQLHEVEAAEVVALPPPPPCSAPGPAPTMEFATGSPSSMPGSDESFSKGLTEIGLNHSSKSR